MNAVLRRESLLVLSSSSELSGMCIPCYLWRADWVQKAHLGKTSDRSSKSMSGTVSYFLGKQEGEFSLRDQVSGRTYLMCSPWCVSHDQETYCKWFATIGSVFTLILPHTCLAPLADIRILPQAGWVSAVTQCTHGPDYAIAVRVQFPLLHQQANEPCG